MKRADRGGEAREPTRFETLMNSSNEEVPVKTCDTLDTELADRKHRDAKRKVKRAQAQLDTKCCEIELQRMRVRVMECDYRDLAEELRLACEYEDLAGEEKFKAEGQARQPEADNPEVMERIKAVRISYPPSSWGPAHEGYHDEVSQPVARDEEPSDACSRNHLDLDLKEGELCVCGFSPSQKAEDGETDG